MDSITFKNDTTEKNRSATVAVFSTVLFCIFSFFFFTASPARAFATGDINGDGKVDVLDLQLESNVILGTQTNPAYVQRADLNGDGKRDVNDLQLLANIALGVFPSVNITSPADNTTYTTAQTVAINVTASANSGISKVEFYDNNTLKGTDTSSPYTYSWSITAADNGTHSWTAKAYDAANNNSVSIAVSLIVNINLGGGWSKSFGSTNDDRGNSVAIDGYGNVLMTGYFMGIVDFGGGLLESTHYSWRDPLLNKDVVLAKYSPAGDHLWSKNLGGVADETGMHIAIDTDNSVIVTGSRSSYQVNYDGGVGVGIGYSDVFLAKFSSTGEYLWSGVYGGSNNDYGDIVAVDRNGDILLAGRFMGTANFGGASLISSGSYDIFVAKYSGVDGHHLWSKRFGGVNSDTVSGIAVDSANNIFVTGQFAGVIDFGGGAFTTAGAYDIFVAKFSPSGAYMWSKKFGGLGSDNAGGIAIDSSDRIILTGAFQQTVNFGGGSLTSAGLGDIFIAKYEGTNGTHLWSARYGGTNNEFSSGVAVDANDNLIITGGFIGSMSLGGEEVFSIGTYDVFVAKYSASGTYLWSEVYGGANAQVAESITVNGNSNIAITGYFYESIAFGGINHVSNGNSDIFLLSIEP